MRVEQKGETFSFFLFFFFFSFFFFFPRWNGCNRVKQTSPKTLCQEIKVARGSDTSVMESGNKEGFENMAIERRERKERVTGHY